jgi:hypothetical protein
MTAKKKPAPKKPAPKKPAPKKPASKKPAPKKPAPKKPALEEKIPPLDPNKPIILIQHWEGRFGNRMHSYAYAATYAKKFGFDLVLPSEWEGSKLFKNQPHKIMDDDQLRLEINQGQNSFDTPQYRAEAIDRYSFRSKRGMIFLPPDDPNKTWAGLGNVWIANICAYQALIFKGMSRDYIKNELYVFDDKIKNLDVYKRLEDKQGTYDIAHLRRDDISNPTYEQNYGYSVVSKKSYEKAFKKFGYDPEKIEWTTDDWSSRWGVGHPGDHDWFTRRGSWHYPTGSEYMPDVCFDWLPDFLRIYFARSVFRANSSFGWWACFLGNQKNIYAPVLHTRNIYSGKKGSGQETEFEFIEGNSPHWLITSGDPCDHITIPD